MSYVQLNINPCEKYTNDCTVRALSVLMDESWEGIFLELCLLGLKMCEMPSQKAVIHQYLKKYGFQRYVISNDFPADYSVRDFAEDHPEGKFLLATDSHVIPVISGNYIDSWDSGAELPLFYWTKGEEN
jgi:hypothetical protein